MKRISSILIFVLVASFCVGQDYYSDFQKLFQSSDTTEQYNFLLEWEKADPLDPELYTSYFNHYFIKSKTEILTLNSDLQSGEFKGEINDETLSIKDSTDQVVGFIGSDIIYLEKDLQKAYEKIDKGIELFPNRLDMRFGKIYVIGQTEDYEKFTSEIIKTIQYSVAINNEWTWTYNQTEGYGEDFFLGSIQDYQLQLYNDGNDALLYYMQDIANEIIEFYPNHIESLTNLSISYLIFEEYDLALESLLKAEKIDPKDYIVLANIAYTYVLKEENKKAIEYYEKVIEFGDEGSIGFARDQIEELSK